MSDRINNSIAESLEVDNLLLPYMPFLLQDLWALGSSLDLIIETVGNINFPAKNIRVLDLGCGKGAVSIEIASKFGFNVIGIDAMSAFLDEARDKAKEYEVAKLCRFLKQDITEYVRYGHKFDLVILAALGGIFGSIRNTVANLRTQARQGGYIIIDDGYLKKNQTLNRKGYKHYMNHENTISELTSFNDAMIREVDTTKLSLQINKEYLESIKMRGQELSNKYPELRESINSYIRLQIEECDLIKNNLEGSIWLLQKDGK